MEKEKVTQLLRKIESTHSQNCDPIFSSFGTTFIFREKKVLVWKKNFDFQEILG